MSDPVTFRPMPFSTSPRGRMETPPIPTKWTWVPGTRYFAKSWPRLREIKKMPPNDSSPLTKVLYNESPAFTTSKLPKKIQAEQKNEYYTLKMQLYSSFTLDNLNVYSFIPLNFEYFCVFSQLFKGILLSRLEYYPLDYG